jgi:predicted acylesterase/phospholipase RssA
MRFLAGTGRWPGRPLLIPSVDAETGEEMIWDRHGAASLPEALAASTAFPATAPPITINGHRYIDGALRAGANADLAADADLMIIAEPMAHVFGTGSAAPGAGSGRSALTSPASPPGPPRTRPASGRPPEPPGSSEPDTRCDNAAWSAGGDQ